MHFTTVTANPCVDRTIQVDSVNLGHSHRIQKTIPYKKIGIGICHMVDHDA